MILSFHYVLSTVAEWDSFKSFNKTLMLQGHENFGIWVYISYFILYNA
jgi:hypothetical protein